MSGFSIGLIPGAWICGRACERSMDNGWCEVHRQRAGIAVRALVDVSGSMGFGSQRPKLHVMADFVESMGLSAFRAGDAVGMTAFDFDGLDRADLHVPARLSRGMGTQMSLTLRALERAGEARRLDSRLRAVLLEEAVTELAGRHGLIFVVSDFHWPLERLDTGLDLLAPAFIVPVVVWDLAEIVPPRLNGLASLRDAETGQRRTIWVRPRLRAEWQHAVAQRRAELDHYFGTRGIRPFYLEGTFEPEAMSRYFLEAGA